jgi:hypothetical protein
MQLFSRRCRGDVTKKDVRVVLCGHKRVEFVQGSCRTKEIIINR